MYAFTERLFCGKVGGIVDFTRHAPQVFEIMAAVLAPTGILVALNLRLDLKQLGIMGMNRQSLCNPPQGSEQISGGLQLARL